MQEHHVTVAGVKHVLEEPFFVLATQNPIEMEGTYPLPEAQLDRFFFKLELSSPKVTEIEDILDRTTGSSEAKIETVLSGADILSMRKLAREVPVASHVRNYIARLILATHPTSEFAPEMVKKYVRYGSSPRGAQSLVIAGKISALLKNRYNLSFDDVVSVAYPSLRHRIILNFEGEAEGLKTDVAITKILEELPKLPKAVQELVKR
jgi:MoxR-like ATPase